MKARQFAIAISGVPRYYAVFKVRQVPNCVQPCDLKIGDLMYWSHHRSQMVRVQNMMCLAIDARHIDFVTYMTTAEMQEATHVKNA